MFLHYYKWKIGDGFDPSEGIKHLNLLDQEDALTGPLRGDRDVIENNLFGKDFNVGISELATAYGFPPKQNKGLLQNAQCDFLKFINRLDEIENPILADEETDHARIVRLPETDQFNTVYAAMTLGGDDQWRIRGLILDCDIMVSKTYRVLGFGSGLVAAQLLDEGGLQVWDHDKIGFSTGGKACVNRGFALAKRLGRPYINHTAEPGF
jgi:hypothetical protein